MTTRRHFLKTSVAALAAPALVSVASPALAASGSGKVAIGDLTFAKRRPNPLIGALVKWLREKIPAQMGGDERKEFEAFLKENPKALEKEAAGVAKTLTSGKFEEMPDEEFAMIRIKFRFKYKPPNNFELSLEIEF